MIITVTIIGNPGIGLVNNLVKSLDIPEWAKTITIERHCSESSYLFFGRREKRLCGDDDTADLIFTKEQAREFAVEDAEKEYRDEGWRGCEAIRTFLWGTNEGRILTHSEAEEILQEDGGLPFRSHHEIRTIGDWVIERASVRRHTRKKPNEGGRDD